jgi:hypothetical protein
VKSALYCEVLLKFWDSIRRKHPRQLARGSLLRHDNARHPYSPNNTGENSTGTWNIRVTTQTRPLVDLHVRSAKNHLAGKRFAHEQEVDTELRKCL